MLRIDLYTEITCPWCIVGQHRLDKVLAERFPELLVGIHHHPVGIPRYPLRVRERRAGPVEHLRHMTVVACPVQLSIQFGLRIDGGPRYPAPTIGPIAHL